MKQLLDLCVNTMEHALNRKMNGTRYKTCYVSCQFIYEFRSFQSCLRHWLIFTIRNWTAGKSKHVWISPLLSYIYTWIEIWKHLWNSVASKMAPKTLLVQSMNKRHRIIHGRNKTWNIFYRQENFHFYIRSNYLKYW